VTKNIVKFIIFLIVLPVVVEAKSRDQDSILIINYLTASLVKISTYNDRLMLDQEYNNIINNINLRRIHDEEAINQIKQMMEVITQLKINETDREFIRKTYDDNIKNAMYEAFSSTKSTGSDPLTWALNALSSAGTVSLQYKNIVAKYRLKMGEKNWGLKKSDIKKLDELRRTFIGSLWKILNRRKIDDKKRLTESQVKHYIEATKDENGERRYRKLRRMERDFSLYPPYWYNRGFTAARLGKEADAIKSFEAYEGIARGILRNDPMLASVLMNHIGLISIDSQKPKVISFLRTINDESPLDPQGNIYTAIVYSRIGMISEAHERLQVNIDNGFLFSTSMRIKGMLTRNMKKGGDLESLLEKMIKDDRVRNQDILYLVGKESSAKLIEKIKPIFESIKPRFIKPYIPMGLETLTVEVPARWFVENMGKESLTATVAGAVLRLEKDPALIKETKNVLFEFKDALDVQKATKNFKSPVLLKIGLTSIDVKYSLTYELRIEERVSSSWYDNKKTKKYKDKILGWTGLNDGETSDAKKIEHYLSDANLIWVESDGNLCFSVNAGVFSVSECGS